MGNNRIICHSNKITIVLTEDEMRQYQKEIAKNISSMMLTDYQQQIRVEDFNSEEDGWKL